MMSIKVNTRLDGTNIDLTLYVCLVVDFCRIFPYLICVSARKVLRRKVQMHEKIRFLFV